MTEITPAKGLHRLLYSSRFSDGFPSSAPDQDHEIGKIIQASISNNRLCAVTGLLLVHRQQFLQALEGPADRVMATYNRILADPRHSASRLISAGPAKSRLFGEWNMCARRLSVADDAILRTLDVKDTADPGALSAQAALTLLSVIGAIQKRTMAAQSAPMTMVLD